jgi:oligopeptide transport system substrate-binding protein
MMRMLCQFSSVLFLLATVTSCTPNRGEIVDTIRVRHRTAIKSLDPALAYDESSMLVIANFYETLYEYNYLKESYELKPLLAADRPSVSKDGLVVTIPLRQDIYFQDDPAFTATEGKGRRLKARDFIYSWKRLAIPRLKSPGWWVFQDKIRGIEKWKSFYLKAEKERRNAAFKAPIEGLIAVDDFTLRIELTRPYPQLLNVLAMTLTAPVAEEVVETYADDTGSIGHKPIGTGPYRLKSWTRGHRLIAERNTKYRPSFYPTQGDQSLAKQGYLKDAGATLPLVGRIEYTIVKEHNPAWLGFMNGDFDYLSIPKDSYDSAMIDPDTIDPELEAKGITFQKETGMTFYYVGFNMKDKLLQNKKLRQALASAINRKRWVQLFTNDTGEVQTTTLPRGIPGRPKKKTVKYDFNLTRAKKLLKQAGYPGGKGLPTIKFDLRGQDTKSRQLGEFFMAQWKKIGVKVEAIYNTFPNYLEKAKDANTQITYGGWQLDYPDAENVYQLLYGPNGAPGPNESNFNHPRMNTLYEQMAVMSPGPARSKIILKMEAILQEEVPWAAGYFRQEYFLMQPWIKNYRETDFMHGILKYVNVDTPLRRKIVEGVEPEEDTPSANESTVDAGESANTESRKKN